jgi:hypothetical protein
LQIAHRGWIGLAAATVLLIGSLAFVDPRPVQARTFAPNTYSALVFPPVFVNDGEEAQLCVVNFSGGTAKLAMGIVSTDIDYPTSLASQITSLAPRQGTCLYGAPGQSLVWTALIGLLDVPDGTCKIQPSGDVPPGPCKLVASLEVITPDRRSASLHSTPILLPAVQLPESLFRPQ